MYTLCVCVALCVCPGGVCTQHIPVCGRVLPGVCIPFCVCTPRWVCVPVGVCIPCVCAAHSWVCAHTLVCVPHVCVCMLGVCIPCVCVCVCTPGGGKFWVYVYPVCVHVYPGCVHTLCVYPGGCVHPECTYTMCVCVPPGGCVYPGCMYPACMYILCVCVCACVPVLRVGLASLSSWAVTSSRAVQPRPQQVFQDTTRQSGWGAAWSFPECRAPAQHVGNHAAVHAVQGGLGEHGQGGEPTLPAVRPARPSGTQLVSAKRRRQLGPNSGAWVPRLRTMGSLSEETVDSGSSGALVWT